jgi:hypothetical protein
VKSREPLDLAEVQGGHGGSVQRFLSSGESRALIQVNPGHWNIRKIAYRDLGRKCQRFGNGKQRSHETQYPDGRAVWAIARDSGRQVEEIERSRELGSSQGESPSIGNSKSRGRKVASRESAIGSHRRFGASGIGSWKPEGLVS